MFTAAAILGGATLAATGASIASKRRQERRQLQYLRQQRDYNDPIEQKKRYMSAGLNPMAQEYQNVDSQQFDASQYDIGSDVQNGIQNASQIAQTAYQQHMQSKLLEAQTRNADSRTNVQNETLITQKTQNEFLDDYLKGRNLGQDLQNKLNDLLLSEHPEEHKAQIELLEQQIANSKADVLTKNEFLKVYPKMLQKDLRLQDAQLKDFEQIANLRAPQLVLSEYDNQLFNEKDYKKMYKYLQRSGLEHQAKQMFLALEAYSMDYSLLKAEKDLTPQKIAILRNQMAVTMAQSRVDIDNISQRSKVAGFDAWYDWIMGKVGGLVSLGTSLYTTRARGGLMGSMSEHYWYMDREYKDQSNFYDENGHRTHTVERNRFYMPHR